MAGRLPTGWHWANSRDKSAGAIDPSGQRHSRQETENRGAAEVGYHNAYEARQSAKHTRILKGDPGAEGGRYFAPRTNYQRDVNRAREAAERRGEKWDRSARARFDALVGAMQVSEPTGRHEARVQFLLATGRVGTRAEAESSA